MVSTAQFRFNLALSSLPTLHLFAAPPPDVLALVQSILEEFYTDGIDQVISAELNDKGDIVGEFIDQVGARQVKRYKYQIQDNDVAFKLLNPNEVSNFSFESFKPLFGKGSKAGQKKSCRKGTPCGGTCISAVKTCRKAPGSASKAKIQEVKQKLGGDSFTPASILKWEDLHRLDAIESAGIFDQSGKLIFEKSGTEDAVHYDDTELAKIRGQTLTHNHPLPSEWGDVSKVGLGFSPEDFQMAFWYELAELRVVSGGFRFSLKPPDDGWNTQLWRKNVPEFKKIQEEQLTKSRVKRDKALLQGKSEHEARKILNHDYHHNVAVQFAKKLNLTYIRQKI